MLHEMNAGYEIHKAFRTGGGIAITAKDYPNSHIYVTTDYEGRTLNITGGINDFEIINRAPTFPKIERVIFSPPATIVFWDDKTKTVVKCSECETRPRPDCATKIRYGACFRESDMRFILPYMDAQAEEEWKLRGIIAAMLKKAWGNAAPAMVADALAAGEWNGGADD